MLRFTLTLAGILGASILVESSNVRLVNGTDSCSGRVEIYNIDQWGTVCDDHWDVNDAEVVCKQLRCGGAVAALRGSHFGPGSGPIWLNDVHCSGGEGSITQCLHDRPRSGDCDHGEDAGVVCSASALSATFLVGTSNVRLVNGTDSCSGRVEIYHKGQWGTVCDDHWNVNEKEVVCKQLGCGGAVTAFRNTRFGPGSGPIWLDDVLCSGRESSITECLHEGFGSHDCNHDEDAGVVCSGRNEVRLVNGTHGCCGRVEIQHKGQWGTVCDNNWNLADAEVVCKQLECGRAVGAPRGARFGRGEDPAWLDKVQCDGTERFINQCSHGGFQEKDCGHDEGSGVVCSDLQSPALTQISSDSVLSPGDIVQFRCATPNQTCISVDFHLYKGGSLLRTQRAQSETTFTLTVDSSHQGQYTCEYEYRESSSMRSPRSNSITVTVASHQAYFIGFGTAAGLFLILMPVILCCVKKGKHQPKDDTPLTKNIYKIPQKEMETETDRALVYENVQAILNQREDSDNRDYVSVYEVQDNDCTHEPIYTNTQNLSNIVPVSTVHESDPSGGAASRTVIHQ